MESQKKREARGDRAAVDVKVALGPHAQLGTRASHPTFSQGDKARLLRKKEALFFLIHSSTEITRCHEEIFIDFPHDLKFKHIMNALHI